jgi:large subunit ribosomal protein L1
VGGHKLAARTTKGSIMAEAKKKTATKAKTTSKTKVAKPTNVEKPLQAEVDVTAAALGAASEEQRIITEKRTTSADSALATESEAIYDETLTEIEEAPAITKAGKRSSKAQREAADEAARKERIASGEEEDTKPRQASNPTRSRLERQGKKFRESAKLIEAEKQYDLEEAIAVAQKTSHVKFDATVELHINLNVDPRHADQNIRDNLVLPSGTGKSVRVAVLTDDAATATKAGADSAGNEELLAQLDKGTMDFDILIATPMLMAKLGKHARMLGPRGLMPNPKSGTVTTDIAKAVAEAKAGRVEYRVDSTGIVHLGVGKVSFSAVQLLDNVQAVLTSIKNNKPASVKGTYFKAVHVTTSMGPSIAISLTTVN